MERSSQKTVQATAVPSSIRKTRLFAGFALLWERVWPQLLPIACVVAAFLSVSWLGLWPQITDSVRIATLAVFGIAALWAVTRLLNIVWPTKAQIDRRIENASALQHNPLTTQIDSPSDITKSKDPMTQVLWYEHQKRMAAKLNNLKPGLPVPKVAAKDPFALRSIVALVLFVSVAAGWGDWSNRIGQAFTAQVGQVAQTGRMDAWVRPPAYTNRPPIFLSQQNSGTDVPINVPEGSELTIRLLDIDAPQINITELGNIRTLAPVESEEKQKGENYKAVLGKPATVEIQTAGKIANTWSFAVIPDNNPSISFSEEPSGSTRGILEFAFEVEDDYGVIGASAQLQAIKKGAAEARPLVEAPEINLPLPGRRAKKGTSKTSQDLTSHPWAGAEVTMQLTAEDEAGQTGSSKPLKFTLPERVFTKPLAQAVVEERRNLALDANAAPQVAEMLDIITSTHPDEFIKDIAVYTSLRVIYRMIDRSDNDDTLRDALEIMWETALSIEDGDLSRAERRLRDAQERLSKALENGASDEEVSELMKELRQAMNEFMQELAQQTARNQQNQQANPLDENTQVLRQQDLERLMQQIEDLAKSGSRDAARQLLEELQRMMNNLQTARPGQQQQQQSDEFSQQMNKLGEMMRQQQELMDRTFDMQRQQQQQQGQQRQNQQQQGQQQQGQQKGQQQQQGQQNGQQQGQKPMTAEEFAEAMRQLQEQQGELQRQMQQMQQAMRDLGIEPGKLGEAGEAMGEAESQLGQGQSGQATGEQSRALQAMREGAQQMMQNMQNQAGEQGRRGERGQHGEQSRRDQDPLGRQTRSNGPQLGDDTKVPGEIDAQRAREILETIRRRLGETSRPKLELDYLDRLLPTR